MDEYAVTEEEKRFTLIGYPLGHSVSPEIHQALFALAGAAGQYDLRPLPPEQVQAALPGLQAELAGFNVTIPHKETLARLCTRLAPSAARYRSVNTVCCTGEGLIGYNTDCDGFLQALRGAGIAIGAQVCVLGAGGAGRMFATECAAAGARVTVAVRSSSLEKAQALCAQLNDHYPAAQARAVLLPQLAEGEEQYSLLVNATPCGMHPHPNETPVDSRVLRRCDAVFDAIYNPTETLLLQLARACGCRTEGGMAMLVHQAAAAQTIWTGARFAPEALDALTRRMTAHIDRQFPPSPQKAVVLCGFMGCGKSSVGRAAAKAAGWEFVDADSLIAAAAGMEVSEIFARKGEAWFRALEREIAGQLRYMHRVVVASGGGMLANPENAALLREGTVVVYLDSSFPRCWRRIASSPRPLVQKLGRQGLAELYRQREALYRAAAGQVVENQGSFQSAVQALAVLLNEQ